jgi:hypothetical protein
MEHDYGRSGTSSRSPNDTRRTKAIRTSTHAAVTIASVEVGIVASDNTGNL